MNEDFLKILGIIVVVGFLIYLAAKSLRLHRNMLEGFTAPDLSASSPNGEAGNAKKYADTIKEHIIKMQGDLSITANKPHYEDVIVNMEEYISLLMLKSVLNMNTSSDSAATNIDAINNLNSLYSVKAALNNTMVYIDGQ
jgi:hypothetical protein